MNSKAKLLFAVILILTTVGRAASSGAALSVAQNTRPRVNGRAAVAEPRVPRPASFREVSGRGLIVRTWINSAGPFNFAIDTGAGATLLSPRVADEARVTIRSGRSTSIAGLSGASISARNASIQSVAIGDSENYLPAKGEAMVTSGLPADLDGVLDPTEVFSPLGYGWGRRGGPHPGGLLGVVVGGAGRGRPGGSGGFPGRGGPGGGGGGGGGGSKDASAPIA